MTNPPLQNLSLLVGVRFAWRFGKKVTSFHSLVKPFPELLSPMKLNLGPLQFPELDLGHLEVSESLTQGWSTFREA